MSVYYNTIFIQKTILSIILILFKHISFNKNQFISIEHQCHVGINYPGAEPTNVHWTFATGYFKTFVITTLIVFVHRNLVYLDFSHTLLLPAHLRCPPRLTQKNRHSKSFLPKAVSSLQDAQQICVLLLYF